ncbi:MAG: alpha/beta hydrolase [Alphaproteobacteria bacterium]|jgi:haloacetate dehalogenase|nr:alpha/beta hydrolase [Alphaproteobacteria bacterium]MDP6515082.1 alpha/beta hydrolase [Alphaproteobacteria bacterium]
MFDGFVGKRITTTGGEINLVTGGGGPPVLLLHGYPQSHVMWHKVAPNLAEKFTVVVPDLRGYGDSAKPDGGDDHAGYSKRAMAADQVAVMAALGHEKFMVAGHDRGARVAHRMALDHADKVTRLTLLDIVPTYRMFADTDKRRATVYYHWFFLIQKAPFPETMIGASAEYYLRTLFHRWGTGEAAITDEAFAEYLRCFHDPATIHATCEDYRAAATIDLEHDQADLDRRITCPVQALWGEKGAMHDLYDVVETWRERADDVRGHAIPCGHFIPEEAPGETIAALMAFFGET